MQNQVATVLVSFMVPRYSTWVLERYFGLRTTARPLQLIRAVKAPTSRIFASKERTRLLSEVSTSAGSRQRRWPWYILTFAGGFGSVIAYKSWTEPIPSLPLTPRMFTTYTLVSREQSSLTGSIFTLRPSNSSALKDGARIYKHAWESGIWSVEVKQPQLQIARAYTPLPPSLLAKDTKNDKLDLRFFIRRDPKGEVSGYLHKLPEGAQIDLRGPHMEYSIPTGVGEVLFLAGGTGIAPALQSAHTLLSYRSFPLVETPKIRILWANRTRDDCMGGTRHQTSAASAISNALESWHGRAQPQALRVQDESLICADGTPQAPLVKELMALQMEHPSKLSVEYFVDEESTYITEARLNQCISGKIPWGTACGVPHRTSSGSGTGMKLILISGPDGFVEYLAGPKAWENGKEDQGSLGGVLKNLDLSGWEVWKL